MGKFVTCGTLKGGTGMSDIVCDVTTGDLIFKDDVMGNCLMSNMSITDPVDVSITARSNAMNRIINDNNLDGVIFSGTYLIYLKDDVAEYRGFLDPSKVLHVVAYDLDIEYTF